MSAFYENEERVVVNLLLKVPCLNKDEMRARLKFETKQLQNVLKYLEHEKILASKTRSQKYYFINFSLLPVVILHKLEKMRELIEEKHSAHVDVQVGDRTKFRCPSCESTYTYLDAGLLRKKSQGPLLCTYCETEVSMIICDYFGAYMYVSIDSNNHTNPEEDWITHDISRLTLSSASLFGQWALFCQMWWFVPFEWSL